MDTTQSTVTVKLGEAAVRLTLACGEEQLSARDLTLLGTWSFRVDDLHQKVSTGFLHFYAEVGGKPLGKLLWDEIDDSIAGDDPWVEIRDADSSIMILAILAAAGGAFEVRYASRGSPFWAFHDLSHVRRDAWLEGEGGGLAAVQAVDEDRAHREGALEALDAQVITLAEVARALVVSEPSFLHRFGVASRALDQIADAFERRPEVVAPPSALPEEGGS